MTPDVLLACVGAAVVIVASAFAVVVLFAYALAIWDTYKEGRES